MKFDVEWMGEMYSCEWSDNKDFENLENITGVHGFVFDKEDKLLIIKFKKKNGWTIPGGHPEDSDKTLEETLIREIREEADIDLKEIRRVGYVKSFPKKSPLDVMHQVRFVARVKKINEQTADPCENEVPLRKFIDSKDFTKFTKWETNGKFQLRKALENLR